MVPALLKWVGSKQRSAQTIVDLFPASFNDYYEPFLGSGAVLAELMSQQRSQLLAPKHHAGYASDFLPFLIGIFQEVKERPEDLCSYYEAALANYDEDPKSHYMEIRERFNASPNPEDFCVLSRTCYSGIIRFRKRDGYMSTPVGAHKPISPESFRSRAFLWHDLINDVQFSCCDFADMMERAKPGDLVYCDPPYTHSQSILYGSQDFEINRLWESIAACKKRGCFVALSINGSRNSGAKNIAPAIPEGLFERRASISCGTSMIDRLQNTNKQMLNAEVKDQLLLTW